MSAWDDLDEPVQAASMMLRGGVSGGQEAGSPYSGNAGMTNQGHTWIDYEAPKPNKRQQAIKDARINNMVFGQGYDPQYAEGRIPAQQNAETLMRLQQTTGDMRYQQPIPMGNYVPAGRPDDRMFGHRAAPQYRRAEPMPLRAYPPEPSADKYIGIIRWQQQQRDQLRR